MKIICIFVLLELICVTSYELEEYSFSCRHCFQSKKSKDCNDMRLNPKNCRRAKMYINFDNCDFDKESLNYDYRNNELRCEHNIYMKTDTDGHFNWINCSVETINCVREGSDCCVTINGTYRSGETTTTTTTTITNVSIPVSTPHVSIVVVPLLLLSGLVITLLIIIATILFYKLRKKQTENNGFLRALMRNAGYRIANNFEPTNRENNNSENNPQESVYCEIARTNTIETKPNTKQIQDNSPQYGLIINELYAGFVEGEVADVKLYEELSQQNNQISPTYSIVNNPLYNVSLRHKSVSQISNYYIEPSGSLPELEYSLKCCPFEIKIGELEIGEQFASGHFGVVYRATYHTVRGDIPVAVKTLIESSNSDTKVSFMTEAATLAQFSHPNVLRLIGVITVQQPWMIVTELLKTELRELLIKLRGFPQNSILPNLLFKFSQEIAAGMEYLSGIHFIHRDLAARNVLVAKDLTIRVADFGMSREVISENDYYTSSGGTVPLRWTAPEAVVYRKYSEKSDVWSYGMTLYEIWTLGDQPWGNSTNQEIIEAMTIGQSPPPPSDCPQGLCSVMQKCWRADKTDRPTFSEIINFLSDVSIPVISPTN